MVDAADNVVDDFVDDVTDWSPKGVTEKIVGYSVGVLAGIGCAVAGGTLVCIPVAYAGKRAGKALGGWLFDEFGPATNEWGPLNTLTFSWPILLGTVAQHLEDC